MANMEYFLKSIRTRDICRCLLATASQAYILNYYDAISLALPPHVALVQQWELEYSGDLNTGLLWYSNN